ncbi:TPA: GNAT family N-acetyltransferase [Photobacterium damselae]
MNIRAESPSDIEQIESLTYAAFENHPHHEPGAKPTEHLIVNKLRESNALTISLVCEDDSQLVGHIAFSPVRINGKEIQWCGLGPVSVIPSQQGKGIGHALIQQGILQAQELGFKGVVLLGEPEYYTRFGFTPSPKLTLDGVPPEFFLVKALEGEIPSGEVSYHPAFFE